MQTLHSNFMPVTVVRFPSHQNRQLYMHSFDASRIDMPLGYRDYRSMVEELLVHAGIHGGPVHMTVDEKTVMPGMSQRRPHPHVDGCFIPKKAMWGHGGGGWLHHCNNIAVDVPSRMAVIVAASAPGCRVWPGTFVGDPKNDGDLRHIKDQLDQVESVILNSNVGFILSPDCVHESIIYKRPTRRQFIRLAFSL